MQALLFVLADRLAPYPTPTPRLSVPSPIPETRRPEYAPIPAQEVQEAFIRGYLDASGDGALLEHVLRVVIPCESKGDPRADNGAGHRGLTQFSRGTWTSMMPEYPYDPHVFDPYLHGVAVARLIAYVQRTPGSTYRGQWSCWT